MSPSARAPAEQRPHLAQQSDAVRAAVALVAVREVSSDVPERRRAQQRVHHRVGQHVRVGVAQ